MAKRKKAVHALEGAAAFGEVQAIIRRLVEDAELREAASRALDSSRKVVDRVSGTRKPAKLLEDKKLRAEAIEALDAIRNVAVSLTGMSLPQPKKIAQAASGKKKKRGGLGKLVVLGGVGGAAAMVASENVRSKVLDALFGAEEEFEYSPPPPASADAPGSPLSAV
jgi:hypothetical protein